MVIKQFQLRMGLTPLEQLASYKKPDESDWVCVTGLPEEYIPRKLAEKLIIKGGCIILWCTPLDPDILDIQPKLNRNKDIALDYPETAESLESGQEVNNPNPEGLSGSGVWLVQPNPKENIWHPELFHLIGIQRAWNSKKRILKATQIKLWLDLIEKDYPRLSGTLSKKARS